MNSGSTNKRSRLFKALLIAFSVLLIIFAALKIGGVREFDSEQPEEGLLIFNRNRVVAEWESEPYGSMRAVHILQFDGNGFNDELMSKQDASFGSNGFLSLDDFLNLNYASEMLYDVGNVTEDKKEMYYYSILPSDCAYVEINGKRFSAETAAIDINGKSTAFRHCEAALPYTGIDYDNQVILIDEKGKAHKDPENIFE